MLSAIPALGLVMVLLHGSSGSQNTIGDHSAACMFLIEEIPPPGRVILSREVGRGLTDTVTAKRYLNR